MTGHLGTPPDPRLEACSKLYSLMSLKNAITLLRLPEPFYVELWTHAGVAQSEVTWQASVRGMLPNLPTMAGALWRSENTGADLFSPIMAVVAILSQARRLRPAPRV